MFVKTLRVCVMRETKLLAVYHLMAFFACGYVFETILCCGKKVTWRLLKEYALFSFIDKVYIGLVKKKIKCKSILFKKWEIDEVLFLYFSK